MIHQNISNAIELISGFSDLRYPVNLDQICQELGIKVKRDKPLGKDGYLICGNGKKIILINNRITNRHRQNFVIAHELGHFLLHRSQLFSCDHISDVDSQNVNSQLQESEANAFATELLIPSSELAKHIPVVPITFSDISDIADVFDVSFTHAAMQAVLASNSESEILICYEGQRCRWYKSAHKYTYPRMIPQRCPVDLFSAKPTTDIVGAWTTLYNGSVHQEIFSTYGNQHLVLLSGDRI